MTTPITGTQITEDTVGLRESLADIIAKVDPVETPLYSNLDKTRAKAVAHEWQEWGISPQGPAVATNLPYRSEGEEPDPPVPTQTTLYSNPTSIFFEDYLISGTLQSVDVAGRNSELSWSRITAALTVRGQVETALLQNVAAVATPEPRVMAGLPAWMDGGDGTAVNASVAVHTPTALETAAAALTKQGKTVARTCLMTPGNKNIFSQTAQTGIAKNVETDITSRIMPIWEGAVSIYLTDMGPVQIVVDNYMDVIAPAGGQSFLFDERKFRVAQVEGRVFQEVSLAKTGDAFREMVIWEGTLEAGSPNSGATLV